MDFLCVHFIKSAISGDEALYRRAIALMDGQKENCNPTYRRWNSEYSPISFILLEYMGVLVSCKEKKRAASLILSLYGHCGAIVDQRPRPRYAGFDGEGNSDLALAARGYNSDAFETLLLTCKALFGPNEDVLQLLFDGRNVHDFFIVPARRAFLQRLPALLKWCLLPSFNPDIALHSAACALHHAVGLTHARTTDPDPETVRILIEELGADSEKLDAHGRTPFEALTLAAASVDRDMFDSPLQYEDWEGRVVATKAILQRHFDSKMEPRGLAVCMANHERLGENSGLRVLSDELLRKIALQNWQGRNNSII
jgi:hypothetical protein